MSAFLRFSSFAVLVLSVMLSAAPAAASGDDSALTDQARKLVKEGITHFREKEYEKARAALTAAWAIKKHHQIAGALGTAELKTGRFRDAAEHLHYYIESLSPEAPDRQQMSAYFNEAKGKVGLLRVSASVPNATIKLGDRTLAADELDPLFVDPGAHSFKADREGYDTARATVQIEAGTEKSVKLALKKSGDGAGLPAWPGYLMLGLGGAGMVAGAVLIGVATGPASDADALGEQLQATNGERYCPKGGSSAECGEIYDLRSESDTLTNAGAATLIGGGVLAIGGLVYVLVAPADDQNEARLRFVPMLTPTTGMLGLSTTW